MSRIFFTLLVLAFCMSACSRIFNSSSVPPTQETRTLTLDGIRRSYIVHVPPSHNGNLPMPLVFDFHGGLGNASTQMRTSNFDPLADEKGFLVVYPNGTGLLDDKLLTWNGGTCCGYAARNNIDDVGFVRAVVGNLESSYRIDPKRIYATGFSNGGILSQRLACEASDLFAAIAPVSGTLNDPHCSPSQPVSIIEFHGTADQHIPYNGGNGDKSLTDVAFASVKESLEPWIRVDRCSPIPQTVAFSDVQHDQYSNCTDGTSVELYTILGGAHAWPGANGPAWPGGDQPTHSISATKLMWDFFAAHPKP